MNELSQPTKNLLSKYQLWRKSLKPSDGAPVIHVDEVALRVAAFYEHIRTIVDWKEEHLMRRAAIIRKLKRRFLDLESNNFQTNFSQANTDTSLAETLVLELIRGGYFPNDKIEESKIQDVQKIINKYIFILKNNPDHKKGEAGLENYSQLLEIASCEIEETLAPSMKEMALIDYMFEVIKERISVNENIYERNLLKKEDKDIQIYVAVQQALFKLDSPIISYNLIRYKYPQWNNPTQEELLTLAQNINNILQTIESDLNHPLAKKFYAICEKYDTAYLIIGDILSQDNFEKISKEVQEPALLEGYIRNAYEKRLADLKAKISRAAIYSTVSIFITKILLILILEYIISLIFKNSSNLLYLLADVIIPTGLMAALVIMIRPPSKKNINLVIVEIMKIFYTKGKVDTYIIKASKKKGVVTRLILSLVYLFGACISFGLISFGFYYFGFPIYSIIINIIFIALILFAGTLIQKRARELTIEEESGGFLIFFADILFLPVTGTGRWMSNKWKKYNAVTAFLNALIDMPFGIFVEFLERWRGFIKEKKEELR